MLFSATYIYIYLKIQYFVNVFSVSDCSLLQSQNYYRQHELLVKGQLVLFKHKKITRNDGQEYWDKGV